MHIVVERRSPQKSLSPPSEEDPPKFKRSRNKLKKEKLSTRENYISAPKPKLCIQLNETTAVTVRYHFKAQSPPPPHLPLAKYN